MNAFYEPDGDGRFHSTVFTRGPWDPGSQHAGPPSALIGRAIERAEGGEDKHVGRVTFEILRPVPVATLRLSAEVVRPGRRVDLVEATLTDDDGGALVRARAWRLALGDVELPFPPDDDPPPPGPDAGRQTDFFPVEHRDEDGYHTGVEWRFVEGAFNEPGPALVWLRMRVPLLPDERPSPLARVLAVADSGNGVSARLDPRTHLFINTDLTVHLHRYPVGEWVCLDAHTVLNGTTIGLSESALSDERGHIGRSLQTLLVAGQR